MRPKVGEEQKKKRSSLAIGAVLCSKLGKDQKKKKKKRRSLRAIGIVLCPKLGKKKVFAQVGIGIDFLRPISYEVQNQRSRILIANPKRGRATFALSAKIGLRSNKNRVVLHTLNANGGGHRPQLPWLRY